MRTPKRKAVGGYHTTTTTIKNGHVNIAPTHKKRHMALKCCDRIHAGAKDTVIDSGAFTHALSWVFSRPNTLVYGRDGLVRKAGRMAESMSLTSRPPVARKEAACGFQSHSGAETMKKVNSTITPKAAPLGHTPAISTRPLARQQAIENALSLALYYIRQDEEPRNIHAATVKAVRAAAMLKQACAESTTSGRA